jgi:hypothetical protein
VPEVLEAGLQLGQIMLEHVGLPTDAAREVIDAERVTALREYTHPYGDKGTT